MIWMWGKKNGKATALFEASLLGCAELYVGDEGFCPLHGWNRVYDVPTACMRAASPPLLQVDIPVGQADQADEPR